MKKNVLFTALAVILIVSNLSLASCGGRDNPTKTTTNLTGTTSVTTPPVTSSGKSPTTSVQPSVTGNEITGTLSSSNLKIAGKGVSIEVSPVCLNEQAEVTVTPRNNLPLLGEIEVNGYNFEIDTSEELAGAIVITLPFDKSKLEVGLDISQQVGAAYFNQNTGAWESVEYEIDEAGGNVIITTDHLSVFGAFVVGKEYTRAAYIEYTLPKAAIRAASAASTYTDVITEAIDQDMIPGPSALELGNSIVGNWLNISGAGLTLLTNTVYATEFLNGISSAMTNLGLFSAIAQAAVDYQNGNNVALHTNLIKNLSYYAVSKFGSAVLQLGSVGVFCIDYALSEFANEAISGRRDIYQEAYRLYYSKEARRTAKDWYNTFLPMARTAKTPAELNALVMAEIDHYCAQFWQDETVVAFYQDQAQKNGFTGGGGLNQSIMNEISNNQKFELLQGTLQPVFSNISRKMAIEREEQVRKELDAIAKELNKIVTIQLFESANDSVDPKAYKSKYAGYIARIAPLADEVMDKEKWQQVIDNQGKASLPFRILGHIMAGAPNKIEIVSPDNKNEVVKTVEFVVAPPSVQVDISDKNEENSGPQVYTNTRSAKLYNDYFIADISFTLQANWPFVITREVVIGDSLGLQIEFEKYSKDIVINVEAVVSNLRFSDKVGYGPEFEPIFKRMYWSTPSGEIDGTTATIVLTHDGRGMASFGYDVIIDIHNKESNTYSWGGGSSVVYVGAVILN